MEIGFIWRFVEPRCEVLLVGGDCAEHTAFAKVGCFS